MNSLVYRTLFCVNIYGSYKLLKTVRFFWPTLYIKNYVQTGRNINKLFMANSLVVTVHSHCGDWPCCAPVCPVSGAIV